jgi:hypothetical protein
VLADFELGLSKSGKAAAIEQLGYEAAPKRFGVDIVVAVAPPAHTLQRVVFCDQGFEAGDGVLAAQVGMDDKPRRGPAQHEDALQGLIDQVFGHRESAHPGRQLGASSGRVRRLSTASRRLGAASK